MGGVGVVAPKFGPHRMWHPACFVCRFGFIWVGLVWFFYDPLIMPSKIVVMLDWGTSYKRGWDLNASLAVLLLFPLHSLPFIWLGLVFYLVWFSSFDLNASFAATVENCWLISPIVCTRYQRFHQEFYIHYQKWWWTSNDFHPGPFILRTALCWADQTKVDCDIINDKESGIKVQIWKTHFPHKYFLHKHFPHKSSDQEETFST